MNRISRWDWLPERQDGAILPVRDTGYVPQGTFIMLWCFIPYNKSFIDQACLVKMTSRLVNNPYVYPALRPYVSHGAMMRTDGENKMAMTTVLDTNLRACRLARNSSYFSVWIN